MLFFNEVVYSNGYVQSNQLFENSFISFLKRPLFQVGVQKTAFTGKADTPDENMSQQHKDAGSGKSLGWRETRIRNERARRR